MHAFISCTKNAAKAEPEVRDFIKKESLAQVLSWNSVDLRGYNRGELMKLG